MNLKSLIFIAICLLLSSCKHKGTTQFDINGEVKNLNGVKVVLEQNGAVLDSAIIENNHFTLTGIVWDKMQCNIVFSDPKPFMVKGKRINKGWLHAVDIFVEDNASYKFYADGPSEILYNDYKVITSSKAQQKFEEYRLSYQKERKKIKDYLIYLGVKQDSALQLKNDQLYTQYTDSIRLNEKALGQLNSKLTRQFIVKDPNNYAALYFLSEAPDVYKNVSFYNYINQRIKKEYLGHPFVKKFKKKLETAIKMDTINTNLKVKAVNSLKKEFNYNNYAESKLIIIDFWATWCAPCLKELPYALKFEKEFSNKKVSYVFLSFDENEKVWAKQSQLLGLKNSYLLEAKNKEYINNELDISTIPRYIILNNKGDVLVADAPSPSTNNLKALVNELLKK